MDRVPGAAKILGVVGTAVLLLASTAPAIASASTSVDSESASTPAQPLPPTVAANQAEDAYQDHALLEGMTVPIVTVETATTGPRIVSHDVDSSAEARDVATAAAKGNDLIAVQPDTRVGPTGGAPTTDPYAPQQWSLDPTKTTFGSAWNVTTGKNVTVAVIDTGVQATHPDLTGQVLAGKAFLKGVTDKAKPTAAEKAEANPQTDGCGHGTHVAGTIAALRNNKDKNGKPVGITGAAPSARILPVKVLNSLDSCRGYASDVANGIKWAADNGAKVINLSLGGTVSDAGQNAAITYARSKGVVVVAAAGNNATCLGSKGATSYPGASAGVIGVGAVDNGFGRSCYSNVGTYVDIAAPGSYILATYPTTMAVGPYVFMSGTSMATPHVAAAAALILSKWPTCTPAKVEARLESTARRLGGTSGRNTNFGYGLVDPYKAVNSTSKTC